ncbi:MAG: extracellular solute-binding protein [Chloroflexi bacterium]|nr:extracellular solute-binding protein [Chloroflexota bacterium]
MTRRKLLGGALLGTSVSLLLSCGGGDEEDRPPQDEPGSRVGVGVDAAKEVQQFALAVLDHPLMVTPGQKAIQEWTRGNVPGAPPGTSLQLVLVPTEGGARDFLATQSAGGVSADFIWLPHQEDVPDIYKTGLLAPLDRWLQADDQRPLEVFAEEARRLVRFRAQTLALPIAVAPGVLAHNSLRFERAAVAAPTHEWTWEDFIEAAKRLTEDLDGDGSPDRWGFVAAAYFPDWLPLLLQEGGTVADLDMGKIGMDEPASLRALSAWDELGRVHGILPYGPEVTTRALQGYHDLFQRGMFFSIFFQYLPEHWRLVTPMPAGASNTTPLVLTEALAIPDAAQGERAYEILVPLASWLGERRVLPSVTAGWQFIKRPDRDHFDLVFSESTQDTVLQALANAKASHVASSPAMTNALFNIITYRLARDEVGVEQAATQATDWLTNYVNE